MRCPLGGTRRSSLKAELDYGPLAGVPLIVPFYAASDEAYTLFQNLRGGLRNETPQQSLVFRLVEIGEEISYATRLLVSSASHLAAIALARVRLEGTIVASYVIHDEKSGVLERFRLFGPISEHNILSSVLSDPTLRPHVEGRLDPEAVKHRAALAQQVANPGFDPATDKFERRWTKLDLPSMAQRRDTIIDKPRYMLSEPPLCSLYNSIYRTASSVVHSEASMAYPPFSGEVKGADGVDRPAETVWTLALPAFITHCDLIQTYEALRWAGIHCDEEYLRIVESLSAPQSGGA
jgi:hypothetical protein